MSVKISSAISADGICEYHHRSLGDAAGLDGGGERSYYARGAGEASQWFGKEADALGLLGKPVTEADLRAVAEGRDPRTGEQLIKWKKPAAETAEPWVKNSAAWRAHVEGRFVEAMNASRFDPSAHGDRLKPIKQAVEYTPPPAPEISPRVAKLLEMHLAAKELFQANLAGEDGAGLRRYLTESRKLTPETVKEFGLGLSDTSGTQLVEKLKHYGPELMEASGLFVKRGSEFHDRFRGRLMFPLEDTRGEVVGFAGRKPPGEKEGPKYVNSPETEIYKKSELLYGFHRAAERASETGTVVVVEGYMDVIAAHQAGQRNTVAIAGTALTEAADVKRAAEVKQGPAAEPYRAKQGDFDASRVPIMELWRDLGGGEIRGGRAKAFWREGDGASISIDREKNVWHDFVSGTGGGTIRLAAAALNVSDQDARRYLKEHYQQGESLPTPQPRVAKVEAPEGPKQAELLKRIAHTAVIAMDADVAGEGARARNIPILLRAGLNVSVLELPDGKDSAGYLEAHKAEAYRKQVRAATPLIEYLGNQARAKFLTPDADGKIDTATANSKAALWMMESLAHVAPEQREFYAKELDAYLKQPPTVKLDNQPMEHRAGWDLVVSAPKSISLTAGPGGDTRVREAHVEAAREAVAYAEKAIQVKMGGMNPPETTGRMVACLFQHDTARPVDGYAAPQLHTHAVVFNMSQDSTGQYRALNPKELFYIQAAMESVYQNSMALRLKALGYELEYGKGLAIEIKGYTKEYRDAESPRTKQIDAERERLQMFGPKADNLIALSTRAPKEDRPAEEIRAQHLEHAEKYGNQPQAIVAAALQRQSITYSPEHRAEDADHALTYAKAVLCEKTTVMEDHEIHRIGLRYKRGYIGLADLEAAFEARKEEFVQVEHWRKYAPGHRWTTPEMIAKERKILQFMADGRGAVGPVAGSMTKDQFRKQFRAHLNDNQKHLVWNLIHSKDRMVGVQGLAGAGKTRTLTPLREFVERYGFEVRGLAATSTAVNEMQDVGVNSQTMQSFIAQQRDDAKGPRAWFVDESSLVDVHNFAAFLDKLKPADRMFVIGDKKQHGSLGAGRVFAELQEAGMETFRLNKIIRQIDPTYQAEVRMLAAGRVAEMLESLDNRGGIQIEPNQKKRFAAIAREVIASEGKTLVVAPDNMSRLDIAATIRTMKQEAGLMGQNVYRSRVLNQRSDMGETAITFAAEYRPGDVVLYGRDQPSIGFRSGDYASVVSVDRDANLLTVMRERDGLVATYDPSRTATHASVFEPTYRDLAVGERIQFTKQWKEYIPATKGQRGKSVVHAANRALGTIERLDDGGNVTVKMDVAEGKPEKKLSWNLEKMPHVDYSYAMTSYSAQGTTTDKVIIHIDTDAPGVQRLLSQQLLYVAASRGREDVKIFTNDREELDGYLSRDVQNATALAPEQVEEYKVRETVGVSVA